MLIVKNGTVPYRSMVELTYPDQSRFLAVLRVCGQSGPPPIRRDLARGLTSLTFPVAVFHSRRNRREAMQQALAGVEARLLDELAPRLIEQVHVNIIDNDFHGPHDE